MTPTTDRPKVEAVTGKLVPAVAFVDRCVVVTTVRGDTPFRTNVSIIPGAAHMGLNFYGDLPPLEDPGEQVHHFDHDEQVLVRVRRSHELLQALGTTLHNNQFVPFK